MENFKMQITAVNVRYDEEGEISTVEPFFFGQGDKVNLSGSITLTAEEYEGNEPLDKLELLIRQKASERILENIEQ